MAVLPLILFGIITGAAIGATLPDAPKVEADPDEIDPALEGEPSPEDNLPPIDPQYWVVVQTDGPYDKDDFLFGTLEEARAFYDRHNSVKQIDVTEFFNNGVMWSKIYDENIEQGTGWSLPQQGKENIVFISVGHRTNTIEEWSVAGPAPIEEVE